MSSLQICGGRTLTPKGWSEADISIEDGTIASLGPATTEQPRESATPVLDASGLLVVPGFVDLQVNGGWGIDFASDPAGIWRVGEILVSTGVTSWLPTLITSPEGRWGDALESLHHRPEGWAGAEPLGWHFEGPWLNPDRKGAHREELLRTPELPLDPSLSPGHGVVLFTLAPELPGSIEAIRELNKRGVVVSLGHSDAELGLVTSAVTAGAKMGTHLYNAMSGLHHREPGLAGALLSGDLFFGLIVDGIHSAPEMVKLAWKAAGDRLVLITDSMAGLGLPPGVVALGPYEVHLDGTSARLSDGTLAGSVLDMPTAIRNLMRFTGCSLAEAVSAGSLTPTRVLRESVLQDSALIGGLDRGQIVPGARADLVVIDEDVNVIATIVGGQVVYESAAVSKETAATREGAES